MLQFIYQILNNDNVPLVGMRVACASSDTGHVFEGLSTPSGIIGPWHQTLVPSSLAPQCEGFTRCRFAFAVAEVFGPKDVPWPVINVDLNLRTDLTNYILMRCDTNSYTLAVSRYSTLEWNAFGLKGHTGPMFVPNHALTHRLPPVLSRTARPELGGTPASPFPSPMKGIEYQPQMGHREIDQKFQAEDERSHHLTQEYGQSKRRQGRNPRNRRKRAQKQGSKDRNSHCIKKRQAKSVIPLNLNTHKKW